MTARNEDFLFAQEAIDLGYVTEAQVEEGFLLQRRMADELRLDERLSVILVKRGWMGEEQARRVASRIEPSGAREEIAGYRIVETIGRGAMGTVYKAVHLGLHRVVAIKVLRKDLAQDPTQVERLRSEAKLLASLDHPNIVRALDAGESNGFPFVVMEYVEGESLRDRISRQGPLPEEDALKIARGLADALERARRMGVVHRDVKPGNVLLARDGSPKLMDLGLAKGPIDLGLTQHGATVGTPQYISPEQAQDPKRADTRSDIYSLGATLYAMLTGRPPFEGATLAEIIKKVLYETPMPPRVLNREVSPEVAYLIERMMLKDPSLRYRTPAEVVHAIDRILGGASIVPRGFTGSWEGYLLRMRARRIAKVGGVTVALGVILGVAVSLYVEHRRHVASLGRAESLVARTLGEGDLRANDDEATVRSKLERVRAALRSVGDLDAPRRDELVGLERSLDRALRELVDWGAQRVEVERLVEQGAYDEALARIDAFQARTFGVNSPARRAAQDEEGTVRAASASALTRVVESAAAVGTWGDLIQDQRGRVRGLAAGFVVTPEVRSARDHAEKALAVLEAMDARVDALAQEYSDARVRDRAERFALDGLLAGFQAERDARLREIEASWGPLERRDLLARGVRDLLAARLAEVEAGLERTVAHAWSDAERRLRSQAGSRDLDTAQQAPDALWAIAKALEKGGFARLALEAYDAHARVLKDLEDAQRRAKTAYADLVQSLLADLRDGRTPEDLRARIQRVQDLATEWPDRYRADLKELHVVADGLKQLYDLALDGLAGKKVKGVLLRDGTTEKSWEVLEVHHAEHAVTVVATRDARPLAPERRPLTELAPSQIEQFALLAPGDLPALPAAVALLAQLPDREGALDLRPIVEKHRRIVTAWRDAARGGELFRHLEEQYRRVRTVQEGHEARASTHHQTADTHFLTKDFQAAHYYLNLLLDERYPWRRTDYFDGHEAAIRVLLAQVEAQLFNVKLQTHFPGARISGEEVKNGGAKPTNGKTGASDVVTKIRYDFETTVQLEIFRKEPGSGLAVLAPYVVAAAVTPEQVAQERLVLLRGLDEDLTRGYPLALPNPFDPALPIVVEFDLFTLTSPSFFAVDVDGLQVGILSLDPTSSAYGQRFAYPEDVPTLDRREKPPTVDYHGRGRGVAFHAGQDFGDPPSWEWPPDSAGREHETWKEERKKKDLQAHLFAFEPGKHYRVKVVREGGRLTLFVDDRAVHADTRPGWAEKGRSSDRDKTIRGGSGRLQILTWTPQAIDNLAVSGVILKRFQEGGK